MPQTSETYIEPKDRRMLRYRKNFDLAKARLADALGRQAEAEHELSRAVDDSLLTQWKALSAPDVLCRAKHDVALAGIDYDVAEARVRGVTGRDLTALTRAST